ncbi:MAG: response regulator [Suipraeoptans sp.]
MAKTKTDKFNTLIVEDEPLILNALERHVNSFDNCFVVTHKCVNGLDALNCLKKEVIHLVITDISMPIIDGLELSKSIHEQYPGIVTLIMTGYADFEYARIALKHNVFDYMLKPINPDDLEDILNKVRLHLETKYTLIDDVKILGKKSEDIVEYAKLYIMENYMNDIDFTTFSSSLGFSSAYLTKLFSKYVCQTPIKYLTGIRIQEAKRLLQYTDLPIQRVGESVGYPDQFYFSKTFRKATGLSPSTFRKQK